MKKIPKKMANEIIKKEQEFINSLVEINKQPVMSLSDAYKKTMINIFIAQAYYFMAAIEKLK